MLSAALGDDALSATPTYGDLASYVTEWSSSRGRASEFEPIQAGTAQVALQNRTGAFDPTNVSSPFYGNLLPLRQSKIQFANPITGGSPIAVYTGFIENFDFARQGPRGMTAVAPLTDGFELLANADVNTTNDGRVYGAAFAAQHVDDRIKAALADANWPAALSRIATGNVNVQAGVYEAGSKILQVCQDAADAEFPGVANFFIDKFGKAAFSGRYIRFTPGSFPDWVTTWAAGDEGAYEDDPTLLPIVDMAWRFGKENLYNDVVIAPNGATAQGINSNHVFDAASIDRYGHRSLPPILGLILLDGSTSALSGLDEAKTFAQYYVDNYKVPHDRITSITFHGQMDDGETPLAGALWNFILKVEINHIVTINTQHPGGGGIAGVDYFVEGIHHNVSRLNSKIPRWEMTLDLSPRALFGSFPG